jgi:hypothetical protein
MNAWLACAWVFFLLIAGCSSSPDRSRSQPSSQAATGIAARPRHEQHTDASAARAAEGSWAQNVGAPASPPQSPNAAERKIEPATLLDPEYASSELLGVRRVVYRLTVAVPAHLRQVKPQVSAPAGELLLDVGDHRLRARFVGPGWPVDEGSEVRLRGDVPGVYLFDADGGRPLSPGQLSTWFEGYSPGMRTRSELSILKDYNPAPSEGPGDLLCAFLAEWTGNPRDEVLRRCTGFLPPGFRFGAWSAELTAIVQTSVPRYELRGDAADPPRLWPRRPDPQLIEAGAVSRIRALPLRARPEPSARPLETPAAVSGSERLPLILDNRTPARLVAVVQGVPIGWVNAYTRVRFYGLAEGLYEVAALRTSTGSVQGSGLVGVPGELQIARSPLSSELSATRASELARPPSPSVDEGD